MLHGGLLLQGAAPGQDDFGTSMPRRSWEESIPSLQPTVGAGAVLANRQTAALAPPSAERERYADLKNSNND
jgi:hypothetical protein